MPIPTESEIRAFLDRLRAATVADGEPEGVLRAALLATFLASWFGSLREGIAVLRSLFSTDDPFQAGDFDEIADEIDELMSENFADEASRDVTAILSMTYDEGKKTIARELALVPSEAAELLRRNIEQIAENRWIREHNAYWISTAQERVFSPQLRAALQRVTDRAISQGLGRREAGLLFEEALGEVYDRSASYWQGLSNHIVTRTLEFGRIRGYQDRGVEFLEIMAVVDDRTTEICLYLDGKFIRLSDVVAQRDRLIASNDPEEIKRLAPWMSPDEAREATCPGDKGRSETGETIEAALIVETITCDNLVSIELSIPPYHWGCRTRTRAFTGDLVDGLPDPQSDTVRPEPRVFDPDAERPDYREIIREGLSTLETAEG